MLRLVVIFLSVLYLTSAEKPALGNRIVGGRKAGIGEYPGQVSIQRYNRHFCGGSIIGPQWILTAAHCMKPLIEDNDIATLEVRAGTSTWNSGGSIKQVKSVHCHPEYDIRTSKYDVALIETLGEFVYSAVIKPLKMLKTPIKSGEAVVVSGWGRLWEANNQLPEDLQFVELKFLSTVDCGSKTYRYRELVRDSMVCTTGHYRDACQGDSGGPLVLLGRNIQVGVVSWGSGCAEPGHPGVYADVTNKVILEFIQSFYPAVGISD